MPPKKKKLCFVLMPFKDEMKEVYWKAIKPAAEEAGFYCLRMDDVKGVYNINRKIVEHIFASDAIVADLTDRNPNVFYELGVAHTIANKTVMIIQKGQAVPFDVHSYLCLQYEPTPQGLDELKNSITESLRCIHKWRRQPTNPVQEFKPDDALVPRSELSEVQKQLRQKEKLLSTSVPLTQLKELQQELAKTKEDLESRPKQVEVLAMKKKMEQLGSQLDEKQKILDNSVSQAKYNAVHQELAQTKQELEQRPQQAEFLNVKAEKALLLSQLAKKEQVEKNLRSELHRVKVTLDEADKKKADETKIIPPPGMKLIPAGEFVMGTSEEQIEKLLKEHRDWKKEWFEREKPAHTVWVDAFFMDQYLVTNTQYAEFLNDWGKDKDEQGQSMVEEYQWGVRKAKDRWEPQKGFEKHPVINVTWFGAQQYARWAGKQLPTEAQWEKAAHGGKGLEFGTKDGTLSPKLANYADSKIGKTTPVGNYPANPFGLFDMSGNVWEWCQDWFDENYYQTSPAKNPTGPETGTARLLRGGSWLFDVRGCRSSSRLRYDPVFWYDYLGFRVVQDSPQ
ncbi:MAG TPA: SUMF1/EgtB/PvdO family nonheme iron enzyme [bacterium]